MSSTAHPPPHTHHHRHEGHHAAPVKYRPGILFLSWIQLIGGLLALNFEAIGSVLYQTEVSPSETLHGTEYAGIYVSIFAQITGGIGLFSVRKHPNHLLRVCFNAIHITLTVFLAAQAFAMCCASGAMLVLFASSWDTILAFVNKVSKSAELNIQVGTSTTTRSSLLTLPPIVAAELEQDREILVGLRSALFSLYFVLFVSAVTSSCFGCCNYCKCWNPVTSTEETRQEYHSAKVMIDSQQRHQAAPTVHRSHATFQVPRVHKSTPISSSDQKEKQSALEHRPHEDHLLRSDHKKPGAVEEKKY